MSPKIETPRLRADDVVAAEKAYISKHRAGRSGGSDTAPWCGLGLSGGGIRSASLALGVLQALAERNILRNFDYISTVSGGGYIGASLQWWLRKNRLPTKGVNTDQSFGLDNEDFPYGPARTEIPSGEDNTPLASRDRQRQNLAYLKAHSAYLIAGKGMSVWSMATVLLRTIVISLTIWFPLAASLFAAIYFLDIHFVSTIAHELKLWSPVGEGLIKPNWLYICEAPGPMCYLRYPALFAVLMYLSIASVGIFSIAAIVFAVFSRAPHETIPTLECDESCSIANSKNLEIRFASKRPRKRTLALSLTTLALLTAVFTIFWNYSALDGSVIIIILSCILGVTLSVVMLWINHQTGSAVTPSYRLRRTLERRLGGLVIPTLAIFALATIPIAAHHLYENAASRTIGTLTGFIAVFSGIGSALYGYYTFIRNLAPSLASQIAATAGAVIFLYATLVLAYLFGVTSIVATAADLGSDFNVSLLQLSLTTLTLLAVFLGFWSNINYVGLHRYYRDRLMESFMPSDDAVSAMESDYSPVADSLLVSELTVDGGSRPGPYPLINTNAIMLKDADRVVRNRGGDNFVISPLFVGSNVTGWQTTDEFIEKNGPLTLASATAASGAAANASAGYIGTGITMNPFVSAVMALLNIRLGLWISNSREKRYRRSIPTFIYPGLTSGIFRKGYSRDSSYIELTDGGHFENLALYELVRRKLAVILIVDGEADPKITLSSLVSAKKRIEEDHGAKLNFLMSMGPERLLMRPGEGYPADVRYAKAPFIVGELSYSDGTTGALIYVKSTLIKEMDFSVAGYLAANPDFPHQTTVDQFFDSEQFDAYRMLGYENAISMIKALNLETTIVAPTKLFDACRKSELSESTGK